MAAQVTSESAPESDRNTHFTGCIFQECIILCCIRPLISAVKRVLEEDSGDQVAREEAGKDEVYEKEDRERVATDLFPIMFAERSEPCRNLGYLREAGAQKDFRQPVGDLYQVVVRRKKLRAWIVRRTLRRTPAEHRLPQR
jgi:hypothetical protein